MEIVRLGTRHPTTLPQRVLPALCAILARHPPLCVMTHFNHPRECTPVADHATGRLCAAGGVLSNQMVLMRGINDDAVTVRELNHRLLRIRIRPYRMYHCDLAAGTSHFRVPPRGRVDDPAGAPGLAPVNCADS